MNLTKSKYWEWDLGVEEATHGPVIDFGILGPLFYGDRYDPLTSVHDPKPDLDSPRTRGHILHLIRKRYSDPGAYATTEGEHWFVNVAGKRFYGPTEGEALVVALTQE
jgi:hypothetical protein